MAIFGLSDWKMVVKSLPGKGKRKDRNDFRKGADVVQDQVGLGP